MTSAARREQLLEVGRSLFAERGFEATSVEEIAAKAGVSKPVVYEHFGGKEGLYAVIVDREMQKLLGMVEGALTEDHPRRLLEQAALALLTYIEQDTDGFRILVRDSPVAQSTGTFASLIVDIAGQVEHLLAGEFKARGLGREVRPDVLPDAGRDGRPHRPVVGRRSQAQEGRRRRPPGQSQLEWTAGP